MYLAREIKNKIKRKICDAVNPESIILFGSYANGTADNESDIDLMVIERELKNSKVKEAIKLRKLLKDVKGPKDILVLDKEEFDFYKKEPGSIVREANEKGEII
ncbi:MAG: nucleotidyltransferase domain-containing protein [Fusobacteriota bacterium]